MSPEGCEQDVNSVNFHVLVEVFEAKKEQTTTFETKIVLSACICIHPTYPEDCRKKEIWIMSPKGCERDVNSVNFH